MIQVIQFRNKCIGCNACVEVDSSRWAISRKDGKCTLVGAKAKKDIYMVNVPDFQLEELKKAAEVCPVKIIHVKIL
ncbi:MAG: ferredoxin [Bacteroidia bacterium]|nr:ferredoxin [Bacteroidia bacterium]MBP9690020.1 ferredoxin [Bacteroidia bacterium]